MRTKMDAVSVQQAAEVLCSCHFTDGFCSPRHSDFKDCRCVRMARLMIEAIMGRMPPSVRLAGLAVLQDGNPVNEWTPVKVLAAMLNAVPPAERQTP